VPLLRPVDLLLQKAGLRPDDVERKAKTVSIRRQAIEPKGIPRLADLKTRRSRRTLDLTDTTLDAIVAHLAGRMKWGLAESETLFCSSSGTIMSKTNFRRQVWSPLLKKANLEPRGFHQTRQTYATLALLSGVPITVVSSHGTRSAVDHPQHLLARAGGFPAGFGRRDAKTCRLTVPLQWVSHTRKGHKTS